MKEIDRNIVGAVIVSRDDKIFLARSEPGSRHVYPGCWLPPGGGIEEGESPEQALKREILEETGIDISPYEIKLVSDKRTGISEKTLRTGEQVRVRMKFMEYLVKISDTDAADIRISLSDEHSQFGWFSLPELHDVNLSPPSRALFEELGYVKRP